jgi:hypothetical protein
MIVRQWGVERWSVVEQLRRDGSASRKGLDQIWDAAETAEHTSLTVLPALMLRARKESAGRDDSA